MGIVPDLIQGTRYVDHEGDYSVGAEYDHPMLGRVKVLSILQHWKGDHYEVGLAVRIHDSWEVISPW